jgi:predicted nucleotidyltransferase
MKTIEEINNVLSDYKKEIVEKYKVKKIGIFGSYVREEQIDESDIDILVEFEEGYKTFDNYMDLKFYFEDIMEENRRTEGHHQPCLLWNRCYYNLGCCKK